MEQFLTSKEEITQWLSQHDVENYTLIPDKKYGFIVNVEGPVNLYLKNLTSIPVKFNEVEGDFLCFNNQLTSLDFCPTTVGGDFSCSNNKLTSLEFCPTIIGCNFGCTNNQLKSLEFCPTTIGGDFNCASNHITSLEFCPQKVGGDFFCGGNAALLKTQGITDFTEILNLHQETLIKIEQEKLSQELKNTLIKNSIDKLTFKV